MEKSGGMDLDSHRWINDTREKVSLGCEELLFDCFSSGKEEV